MAYANILTQAGPVEAIPGGIVDGIDYHPSVPWDKAHAAGWRRLAANWNDFTPPDGEQVTGWLFEQSPSDPEYAVASPITAAIPIPTPERFASGIDAPLIVLDTPDGKGIGYVAAPDGTLVPVVYAHESPYDMAELAAKKQAAIAAYTARMQAAGFTAAEITDLRQFRDVDVDTLFSTLTENQRKFLKVVQAAVVLQIKERVQEANQ